MDLTVCKKERAASADLGEFAGDHGEAELSKWPVPVLFLKLKRPAPAS